MAGLNPINPRTALLTANPQATAHDYNALANRPQINGHTLTGDQTGAALGLQDALTVAALPAQEVSDSGVSGFEPVKSGEVQDYTVGETGQLPEASAGLFTRAYNAAHDYAFDVYHTLSGKTYCRMHSRVALLDRVNWLKTPWYSEGQVNTE